MNYKKIYDDLILKCLNNYDSRLIDKNNGGYYEKHHIIPKCLGGNNDKNNLVLLTAKEHYLVHHLLIKIYPNNINLIYSFWMMCNGSLKTRPKPNQRLYQEARTIFSKSIKGRVGTYLGKKHSEETKKLISNSRKNKCTGVDNPFFGKKRDRESVKKMIESLKNRVIDPEKEKIRREKISISSRKPKSNEHRENIRLANQNDKKRMFVKKGKDHPNSKPIQQFTKDGVFIKDWENGHTASKELGISYCGINNCINGKTKTSGNFIWKFI